MVNRFKVLLISLILLFHFQINSFSQQRNPLIEFCTGTWCQWCPCGDYTIENLLGVFPNLIPLAYHGPVGSDPYANFMGNDILSLLGFPGYPTATVDRVSSPTDYTTWTSKVNSRINIPATVNITIFGNLNPSNRLLSLNVNSKALQNLTGTYKLNVVLVEDSLIYNQVNNGVCISGGSNWVHYWVVRAMINGSSGEQLNSGSSWNSGEVISKFISYNVPSNFNLNKCSIVAFVYKQNSPMYLAQVQQAEKKSFGNFLQTAITVLSPNGGENLLGGSNYNIMWIAENTDSVKIDYTTDSGVSWIPVVNACINSGSFMWELPNISTNTCKIRITSNSNPLAFDESNGFFSINPIQFNIYSGWNLVSVPILCNDMSKSSLFSTAISPAYEYNNGYNIVDTLKNGVGYWIKFSENEIISLYGFKVNQNIISVINGWNIIGPFDKAITVDSITTQPPNLLNSPFYGYGGGYYIANTLEPGTAYWIKTNNVGIIQFNTSILEK